MGEGKANLLWLLTGQKYRGGPRRGAWTQQDVVLFLGCVPLFLVRSLVFLHKYNWFLSLSLRPKTGVYAHACFLFQSSLETREEVNATISRRKNTKQSKWRNVVFLNQSNQKDEQEEGSHYHDIWYQSQISDSDSDRKGNTYCFLFFFLNLKCFMQTQNAPRDIK